MLRLAFYVVAVTIVVVAAAVAVVIIIVVIVIVRLSLFTHSTPFNAKQEVKLIFMKYEMI